MPRTFDSQRLRHQRSMDRRLTEQHKLLARHMAGIILRAATSRNEAGEPSLPTTRSARARLRDDLWRRALKPYYVGVGDDAFVGAQPQSPFAALIRDGVEGAIRIQATRQAAILNRLVKDEAVLQWLTGPRPFTPVTEMRGVYDAYHTFVDPNGYRLSDRIWRAGIETRARVDALLEYHIAQGTSAVRIGQLLEQFLTPGGAESRTRRPYGSEGSYAARRLARTEITAAAGRATIAASEANPYVSGVQWVLSGAHKDIDECDFNARGGPNGDGIYTPATVPRFPNHPHDLCHLSPVATGNVADLTKQLGDDIEAARNRLLGAVGGERAERLRGIMNPAWLTQAIMNGTLDDAIRGAVAAATGTVAPEASVFGPRLPGLGFRRGQG